jgi:large subunit ribosomal protein L10
MTLDIFIMKTKLQKTEELNEARKLFEKSQALVFTDFTQMSAENLRKFRRELSKSDAQFMVMKKRLLGILLKEKGVEVDLKPFKVSIGTIFSGGDIEKISGPAFSFMAKLEPIGGGAKDMWTKRLVAGYDMKRKVAIEAAEITYIGKLPPREILLAQLLGMLAAPIRSFLYLLDQKSKQTN